MEPIELFSIYLNRARPLSIKVSVCLEQPSHKQIEAARQPVRLRRKADNIECLQVARKAISKLPQRVAMVKSAGFDTLSVLEIELETESVAGLTAEQMIKQNSIGKDCWRRAERLGLRPFAVVQGFGERCYCYLLVKTFA